MGPAHWVLVALCALGATSCTRIDLDPTTHREFPRTENNLTAPPADLDVR